MQVGLRFGMLFYGYLNLESTKTKEEWKLLDSVFYGYLNLESTKTGDGLVNRPTGFYGYLNLESTKTYDIFLVFLGSFTVT